MFYLFPKILRAHQVSFVVLDLSSWRFLYRQVITTKSPYIHYIFKSNFLITMKFSQMQVCILQPDKQTKYSLIRGIFTKNSLSILNISQEIEVSIFYMYAFCSLTDRLTDKKFIEQMLIYKRNLHRKNQTFILHRGRENQVFP